MLDDTLATGSAVATEPSIDAGDGGIGGAGTESEQLPAEQPEVQPTEQPTEQPVEQPAEQPPIETVPGQPVPLPKELRALMADKELSAHPLVAAAVKQLQSAYDRLNAYTTHFPTVADAKKFTEAFPGGLQDALAMQEKATRMDDSDSAFYSRDPQQVRGFTESWQTDDPEAFRVLAQTGLETLAAKDPEGYRTLGLTVLEETLAAMQQAAFQRNDQEGAQSIATTFERIFGRKPGEQTRQDPRDRQFQAREQQLKDRESNLLNNVTASFMETSNTTAGGRVSASIKATVDQVLRTVKVTPAQKDRLTKDIYDDINVKLRADTSLQNQIAAIVTAGKRAGRFTPQDQQKYITAIYNRAQALLRSSAPDFINNWTATFLNMKRAATGQREAAAARTDVSGGGTPNLGVTPLTGDKMLNMSDEEIRAYKGPIDSNWRKQMRDARLSQ